MGILVISWVVLSVLVALYASSKGQSNLGFFILSMLLSPLVGFVIALLANSKESNKNLNSANRLGDQLLPDGTKRQTHRARRNAEWASAFERLQTGLAALFFAGVGYVNTRGLFHSLFVHMVVGVVFGLVAAAILPVKPLSSLTVRRRRGS